jgi:hypothetical protein
MDDVQVVVDIGGRKIAAPGLELHHLAQGGIPAGVEIGPLELLVAQGGYLEGAPDVVRGAYEPGEIPDFRIVKKSLIAYSAHAKTGKQAGSQNRFVFL